MKGDLYIHTILHDHIYECVYMRLCDSNIEIKKKRHKIPHIVTPMLHIATHTHEFTNFIGDVGIFANAFMPSSSYTYVSTV